MAILFIIIQLLFTSLAKLVVNSVKILAFTHQLYFHIWAIFPGFLEHLKPGHIHSIHYNYAFTCGLSSQA